MKETRYVLGFGLCCFGVGLAMIAPLKPAPRPSAPPTPLEAPVPLQEWTTADAGALVVRSLVSKLPDELIPGQTTECDPDLGEMSLPPAGGCWMKTDVPPPCPKGKLYAHEGRCWRPVPKTARRPTSGEPRPLGVAEP